MVRRQMLLELPLPAGFLLELPRLLRRLSLKEKLGLILPLDHYLKQARLQLAQPQVELVDPISDLHEQCL